MPSPRTTLRMRGIVTQSRRVGARGPSRVSGLPDIELRPLGGQMIETSGATGVETTQDERTMATLAHALQIIGSWIAPLVIFLINRKSRFVSFHALQALLLQIVHVVVLIVFMVAWLIIIFSTIALHGLNKASGPP